MALVNPANSILESNEANNVLWVELPGSSAAPVPANLPVDEGP